jgi:hypothetical protein
MRRAARLHDDRTSLLLLEKRDQFAPSKLAPDCHLSGLIHGVNLENGLGGIKTDHGNAHRGWFPFCRFSQPALWHIDAAGGVHPIS